MCHKQFYKLQQHGHYCFHLVSLSNCLCVMAKCGPGDAYYRWNCQISGLKYFQMGMWTAVQDTVPKLYRCIVGIGCEDWCHVTREYWVKGTWSRPWAALSSDNTVFCILNVFVSLIGVFIWFINIKIFSTIGLVGKLTGSCYDPITIWSCLFNCFQLSENIEQFNALKNPFLMKFLFYCK